MTDYRKQFNSLTAEGFIGLAEARHVADLLSAIDSDTPTTASPHILRAFRRQIVAAGALNNALALAFTNALETRAAGSAVVDSVELQQVIRQLSSVAVSKKGTVSGWVATVLREVVVAELCSITLRGDQVAGFGLAAADIAGHAFSITLANGGYGANTDATSPTPPWTGIRVVELANFSHNAQASIRGGIALPDGSKGIFFWDLFNDQREFRLEQPVGNNVDVTGVGVVTSYGVGVDMPSGDVYIYLDGVPSGGIGPYIGFFAGATGFILLGTAEGATSGTAAMTFVTDTASYAGTYSLGEKDWCGVAL